MTDAQITWHHWVSSLRWKNLNSSVTWWSFEVNSSQDVGKVSLQMWLGLRTLGWIILCYSRGLLKAGNLKVEFLMFAENQRTRPARTVDRKPGARNCAWCLETGSGQETDAVLGPSREAGVLWSLRFDPGKTCLGLLIYKNARQQIYAVETTEFVTSYYYSNRDKESKMLFCF